MIDTGAVRCLITERLAYKLPFEIDPLREGDTTMLVTANGKLMHVKGTIEVPLIINGLTFVHRFLIMPNLTQDLILGLDFLTRKPGKY